MSALGQKQTCALQKVMSALPPKADMCGATKDVCFGPIVDIVTSVTVTGRTCRQRPLPLEVQGRPQHTPAN